MLNITLHFTLHLFKCMKRSKYSGARQWSICLSLYESLQWSQNPINRRCPAVSMILCFNLRWKGQASSIKKKLRSETISVLSCSTPAGFLLLEMKRRLKYVWLWKSPVKLLKLNLRVSKFQKMIELTGIRACRGVDHLMGYVRIWEALQQEKYMARE